MLDILNTATLLPIADIRTDGGTQARAKLDQATINRYAEDLRDGAEFPPIDVYFDGVDYWLANGFHRLHAHLLAELEEIYTTIHQGTQRDAILHSLGANADHGLPRSDDDKRRSVLRMLRDPEWNQWSNSEIARRCRVSESYVRKLKKEQGIDTSHSAKYTHPKTGAVATMNTTNIGAANAERSSTNAAGLPPMSLVNRATSVPAADINRIINNDAPRPATIPDIVRMIEHINQTADVLTVDTNWIIDYLQTLATRWKLTVNPGDLHAILKQWRRDTLDKQEEEIRQRRLQSAQPAPAQPQPDPTAPEPSTPGDNTATQSPYTQIAQSLADARSAVTWAQDHMPDEQTTTNGALHMSLRKIIADIDVANHLTSRLIKKSE